MYPDNDSLRAIALSPLMSLYWFFDANTVIAHNLLIDMLRPTHSTQEAFARYFAWRIDILHSHEPFALILPRVQKTRDRGCERTYVQGAGR